jgi:hypothetical protein
MDNDLTQDTTYQSSRGPIEIRTMVVTVAVRSYDKLLRTQGHSILRTPLMEVLARRAQLEGSIASEVHAVSGDKRMLRGTDGRFVGGYVPRLVTSTPKEGHDGSHA